MGAEFQGFQGNRMLNFTFWLYFAYENIVKIISHGTAQFHINNCSFKVRYFFNKILHVYNQVKAKGRPLQLP